MHKLIGTLFIIIGILCIYNEVLIEYTKNFNDNIVEVECVCKELIECHEGSYNSLWEYTYDNKEQTYRTKTSTNFGLPKVGEESKIGIDDETQKVVYVKKSVKSKIENTIFGMVFTLSGVFILYATILVEYTKIFRRNIIEIDCVCVGLYKRGGTRSVIWRYVYNGAEMTYRPDITTSFGLPSVGDISKVGIDTNKGRVVYVKKSIKNKISNIMFDLMLILIELFLSYAVVMG